jgi:hypothetical protein
MDREHDARGCRGSGHRLCGAAGCLRAGAPSSTGLRGPASAGPTFHHCRAGGHAISPDSRLVGSAGSPGSDGSAGATAPTGGRAPADSRRGPCGTSSASGRGHSGRSESLLCLDIGLLGLERPLAMDWWPLGRPAQANRRLGGRPLGTTRQRLCVDQRRLALANNSHYGDGSQGASLCARRSLAGAPGPARTE